MKSLIKQLNGFARDTCGATAIEYAVMAGILSIGFIACFTIFKDSMTGMINIIAQAVQFD